MHRNSASILRELWDLVQGELVQCVYGAVECIHSLKSEYSIRINEFSSGTESLCMCQVILQVHILSEFQTLFIEIKPN